MQAVIQGFGTFKKNTEYKVVYTKVVKVDDFTGVQVEYKNSYVVANQSLLLKNFVKKTVELTLQESPTLKIKVVTDIKEVK